jgi:hypothetical protein
MVLSRLFGLLYFENFKIQKLPYHDSCVYLKF